MQRFDLSYPVFSSDTNPGYRFGDAPDGDDSWIKALPRAEPPAPKLPTTAGSSHAPTSPHLSNGAGHHDDKFVKALEAERDTLRSEMARLTGLQLGVCSSTRSV